MIVMDLLSVLILGGVMLYVVRTGLVTPSSKFNNIVSDLNRKVTKLENLAAAEEKKVEAYLAKHNLSRELAAKARQTATNIGNLIG